MIVNVYSKLKSELIVVDILDENNRPVDGVESDKKNGNDNFAGGFNLEKEKLGFSTVSRSHTMQRSCDGGNCFGMLLKSH